MGVELLLPVVQGSSGLCWRPDRIQLPYLLYYWSEVRFLAAHKTGTVWLLDSAEHLHLQTADHEARMVVNPHILDDLARG